MIDHESGMPITIAHAALFEHVNRARSRRSRKALPITEARQLLMAAAASMGLSSSEERVQNSGSDRYAQRVVAKSKNKF
ncbi:MAG: hypothetical protein R2864_05085 [Syntrophotaleaceae bacterium]